jgi:hypothetical protein
VSHGNQFSGQLRGALARPAKGRLRVSPCHRIYQSLKIRQQGEIAFRQPTPSSSRLTHTLFVESCLSPFLPLQFLNAGIDRGTRQPTGLGDLTDTAVTQSQGFSRCTHSQRPLIKVLAKNSIFCIEISKGSVCTHASSLLAMVEKVKLNVQVIFTRFLRLQRRRQQN